MRYDFYLVQRLLRRDDPARSGLERLFALDHLGRSEFIRAQGSLQRMEDIGDTVIYSQRVRYSGLTREVHFVAPADCLAEKITAFIRWLAGPRTTEEPSWFPEAFTGRLSLYQPVDAWWSLDDDIAWALDMSIAEALLQGFSERVYT